MKNLAQTWGRSPRHKFAPMDIAWPLPEQLIGIEIEVESNVCEHVPEANTLIPYWTTHRDGSLRRGVEFVLQTPQSGNTLGKAISQFFTTAKLSRAITSSTHIHLDMMEETTSPDHLQTLVLMIYVLEPGIFALADPGREWSGFTNRLSTAPDSTIMSLLHPQLSDGVLRSVCGDGGRDRYYGLNVMSLAKYGSLEFRYFPTATSMEELVDWISLVQTFKKVAIDLGSTAAFISLLEDEFKYNAFIEACFGKWSPTILKCVPWSRATRSCKKAMALSQLNTGGALKKVAKPEKVVATNKGMAKFAAKNKRRTPKPTKVVDELVEVDSRYESFANVNPTVFLDEHGSLPAARVVGVGHIYLYSSMLYYSDGQEWTRVTTANGGIEEFVSRLPLSYVRRLRTALNIQRGLLNIGSESRRNLSISLASALLGRQASTLNTSSLADTARILQEYMEGTSAAQQNPPAPDVATPPAPETATLVTSTEGRTIRWEPVYSSFDESSPAPPLRHLDFETYEQTEAMPNPTTRPQDRDNS